MAFSALALSALAGALLSGCGRGVAEKASPPDHLVLITVDTWRADHFMTRRAGQELTPELGRFAERSVRFSNASSVGCATSPGVAGILTGLWPQRSGVMINDHVLATSLPTLATMLKSAGFATAAFLANPVLAPGNGFDHGFDHYWLVRKRLPLKKARAERLTDHALEWLDEEREAQRLFLWVHYIDPHGPYQPPADTDALFPRSEFSDKEMPLLPKGNNTGESGIPYYQQYGQQPPTGAVGDYLARYAAEVRYMDAEVGRLIRGLEERGLLSRAAVVLTSDHGEALDDDHGYYFSHANGLTEDQVHVPLVLHYPGCAAGEVVERPVSTADILPTVAGILEVPAPLDIDGRGLLAAPEADRLVVSQTRREASVRDGSWKMMWTRKGGVELYDLAADPGELRDLAEARPEVASKLRRRLSSVRQLPPLAEPASRRNMSPEERRALRALGYL